MLKYFTPKHVFALDNCDNLPSSPKKSINEESEYLCLLENSILTSIGTTQWTDVESSLPLEYVPKITLMCIIYALLGSKVDRSNADTCQYHVYM